MTSIGVRLKQERERLGYSQTAFAEKAESSKKSQIDYEKDFTQPKAGYLAAISQLGADVLYIVTGDRSQSILSEDEITLALKYRGLTKSQKEAAKLIILELAALN